MKYHPPFRHSPHQLLLLAVLSSVSFACEDDEVMPPNTNPNSKAAPSASASAQPSATPMVVVDFDEADFIESEASRDPFRDYSYLYRPTSADGPAQVQRKVKAAQFSLDDLKLTGVLTGRVMLTDPSGFGWIAYTGDFVGRAESVSAGGTSGSEVAINWRVDRIRPDSVVFIREDSAHPDIPPTTRVIPLYPRDSVARTQ
ncbi:MAG: pilus assembly protein PilP [Myxococcota bacterium]